MTEKLLCLFIKIDISQIELFYELGIHHKKVYQFYVSHAPFYLDLKMHQNVYVRP